MKKIWIISRTVLIEAIRRKEIHAVVLVSILVIGVVMTIDFFNIEGLAKFYREIALKIMSTATAFTVIVLGARQLPREFESRTIYPMLAKPVSRLRFLAGKLLGVMMAAGCCLALFMGVFVAGTYYLGAAIPWDLFAQYLYLQMVMMLVLATLSFWLSLMFDLDAAITLGILYFIASATLTNAVSYLYDYLSSAGRLVAIAATILIPQLTLFDLSGKTVHADDWPPLEWPVMLALTAYGGFFAVIYFASAAAKFRRRAL